MSSGYMFVQPLAECGDVQRVGGKAANLGKLLRAGFPVPGGFAVTTDAYRQAKRGEVEGMRLPAEVADAIVDAYRAIGSPAVAVRSSATAEDMADASMAGQYETFLNIEGEEALLDAVRRCWESMNAPRIRAYFAEHGINPDQVAMAVAVQELVAADAAGVLFTANPNAAAGSARREMLLEASWGLGEMVVSGRVQPDVFTLEAETGRVLSTVIADKRMEMQAGSHEERPVPEAKRRIASVRDAEIARLWELGRKAAEHFGTPQDLEWALRDGQVFLLQSRPITTLREAEEAQRISQQTRTYLRDELARQRGPWVVHNLGETLPHPTPLTWSILQPFMSGAGGFGEMYRQAGFEPAKSVEREGFLTLIAGRIYMDASRAPEMFFENFPFTYDVEALKRSPDASQNPPTLPKGTLGQRFAAGKKLSAVQDRLRHLATETDHQLRDSLFPSIVQYVADAREVDLSKLSTEQLIERWLLVQDQVLDSLAPQLLLPSLISGMALAELRAFLAEHFWHEDPDALSQYLSSGGPMNRTVQADADLYAVGKGEMTLAAWLAAHGHRAAAEFDLASPRGREKPEIAVSMAATLAAGESPAERHHRHAAEVQRRVEQLQASLKRAAARQEFGRRLALVRRYVTFREDSKDFLMLGYELLRSIALQAAERLQLGNDIFFLTQQEVFEALRETSQDPRKRQAMTTLIAQRTLAHQAEMRIELPRVLDAGAVEKLGEPAPAISRSGGHAAFALSVGQARGIARILRSPEHAPALGKGYILVCPSTDPSWTPLFVNAAGLVLECGGTLSHGAVVAREMGLPAVVLPDATRIFQDGQEIALDGTNCWVGPAELAESHLNTEALDPDDTRVLHAISPPPAGPKDRRAAKIRNACALAWVVLLLAFFLAPAELVHDPAMRLMDAAVWPVVRTFGKAATVALAAAVIAVVTLLLQKFMTDNARLLEAKRRASALQKEAAGLPAGAPRRRALLACAAPVSARSLGAALVPVGMLLGPLVMPFIWFQQRVDPTVAAPAAGTEVAIIAHVESTHTGPLEITLPGPLRLVDGSDRVQSLPDLRAPLEHMLALLELPEAQRSRAWEASLFPETQPAKAAVAAGDLKAFLAAGIPPQEIAWRIVPPEDFDGTIPVSVATAGQPPVTLHVTWGTRDVPAARVVEGPQGSSIRSLEVVPPRSNKAFLSVGGFGISWVWVYILAYLPMLLIARPLFKVA